MLNEHDAQCNAKWIDNSLEVDVGVQLEWWSKGMKS